MMKPKMTMTRTRKQMETRMMTTELKTEMREKDQKIDILPGGER